jgi:hypothetical protein
MERTEWPDVRLDERMAAIDNTFERIGLSLQRLEDEMRAMRSDLGNEMRAMRGDLSALQRQLTPFFRGLRRSSARCVGCGPGRELLGR